MVTSTPSGSTSFLPDGSQFDHLLKDGETLRIGQVEATALLVPGHTPAICGEAEPIGPSLSKAASVRSRTDKRVGNRQSQLVPAAPNAPALRGAA
jgi:hypothetical protein